MAEKHEKELLDIEKYPNPATCEQHIHLVWASRDSSLCQTPAQQLVLDAFIKIGQFDKKTGVFMVGHPVYGLSFDRLAEVTKMRDKHGHRQLHRVIDQLRDEPSKLGVKSNASRRRKAETAGKPLQPTKPLERLNLIHVIEREGQANRYIVHAQAIYKDAQKNLKENKGEWAAKEQAELEAIARFGTEAPDDTPVSNAEQEVLDDMASAPAAPLKATSATLAGVDAQTVRNLRNRIFEGVKRVIPAKGSIHDMSSFNALNGLLGGDASVVAKMEFAVDYALGNSHWYALLSGPKVACPVAAFVKYMTSNKLKDFVEERWAKQLKKEGVTVKAEVAPQVQQSPSKVCQMSDGTYVDAEQNPRDKGGHPLPEPKPESNPAPKPAPKPVVKPQPPSESEVRAFAEQVHESLAKRVGMDTVPKTVQHIMRLCHHYSFDEVKTWLNYAVFENIDLRDNFLADRDPAYSLHHRLGTIRDAYIKSQAAKLEAPEFDEPEFDEPEIDEEAISQAQLDRMEKEREDALYA